MIIRPVKIAALLIALACGACSHPITIAPDLKGMARNDSGDRINKRVGYFIPPSDKVARVTTSGGGGDKVEYAPYGDLEPALYRTLSNVFAGVYPIKDMKDAAFLKANDIRYVFQPTITTDSSSRNIIFWAPTDFTVTIHCTALDSNIRQVWSTSVSAANDLVSVNEVNRDFGLAGRLAAKNALAKLEAELRQAPQFRD